MRRRVWSAAAAMAAALLMAGCAGLAASTGTEMDRIVAEAHTQVQTTGLVARVGVHDPAPLPTLEVVLDDAHSSLVRAGEHVLARPTAEPGREALLVLVDAAIELVERTRAALESGDEAELRDAESRADAIAADLRERSDLL